MTLQPGIYYESGQRPAPCFRLLTLDVTPGARPAAVHEALASVHRMLSRLPEGRVRDLSDQPAEQVRRSAAQFEGLHCLLGYGRRLFDADRHDPPVTRAPRPDHVAYLPHAGPFPALGWTPGAAARGAGEGDVAIQFTAPRQAAVACAAVEVWKLLADEALPLRPRACFDGFGRHDGRGWLDFHDGVSNLQSSQRLTALEAPADPEWMAGGTYMAFLRIQVELAPWRELPRAQQELIVGRDKLTGGAVVDVRRDAAGEAIPIAAPSPGEDASDREIADFIEPSQTTDPLLEASHIHRANQNRASPSAVAGMRIYRQGYDYFEALGPEGPRVGLNFVSFQRDLAALTHVLHLPGWLGDVNFGGRPEPMAGEPPNLALMRVTAGGLYAVPPAGGPYPGAALFDG